jgi:hypothetical protein
MRRSARALTVDETRRSATILLPNTDPYATKPEANNNWIETGPT